MKKLLLPTLTTAILCTSVLTGCSKDKEVEPSKQTLIAGKKWAITYGTYRIGSGPDQYGLEGRMECSLDDYRLFHEDGKYEDNQGATKCIEDLPQINEQGSWFISGDTLYYHISIGKGPLLTMRDKILKLTETKLILESLPYPERGNIDSALIVTSTLEPLD